jgi:SepF-like predicted cell division protein (DUF552 family)
MTPARRARLAARNRESTGAGSADESVDTPDRYNGRSVRVYGFFSMAIEGRSMTDFEGLDLQSVEEDLDTETEGEASERVTLAVLDGSTPDEEWIEAIERGSVLVLNVEGDLNELAAGFARPIKEAGGDLMHFRGFLIVTPPGVSIDTDRLD